MITIDMLMFFMLGIGLGHYATRVYDMLFGPEKYTAKEWFEEENDNAKYH
jgi:hypothetical protein